MKYLNIRISSILLLALLYLSCTRPAKPATTASANPPPTTTKARQIQSLSENSCDGCQLMFLGMPLQMDNTDTCIGWFEEGQKLKIHGTVYEHDQKTPASDVILYYYHTDHTGHYTPREDMLPSAKKHGHLRGWVKTGTDGQYTIFTSRPAQYPNENIEAHIHVFVKEPYLDTPYYIDEWIFDDDPLVTPALRAKLRNRAGNGILHVRKENDVQVANHDVFLGLNIPGYPNPH